MKRPYLLAVIVACLSSAPVPLAAETPRPNILFLFTDDHARHAISAYGSRVNTTPNLDRLAAGGVLFRNAFVTNSLCGPCRAVILTGKHSHLNGFMKNGDRFDGSQTTFPKLLQRAGYQTAIIGKWHLESDPTGFDHWMVYPGQGNYYNPDYLTPDGPRRIEGYSVEITADLSLEWLERGRDKGKPFMLMCQFKAPHRNWMPGPNYLTMYDDVEIPEPPTLFDDYSHRGRAAREQEMTVARHLTLGYDLKAPEPDPREPWQRGWLDRLTPAQRELWDKAYGPKNEAFLRNPPTGDDLVRWKYQRYMKDYLRCVAAVDDNVGRLLDYLEKTGLDRDTIVVYSSDQGFYLGDHGWFDKRFMYEESLTAPLIVRWPGVTKPGAQDTHMVQNLDFAQTFLEMAGVEAPADMQGRSLVPLLKGQDPADWRRSIYYEYFEFPAVHMVNKHYGVRTERYKLMYFHELDEWEFYDLETDPREMCSKYDDPDYATPIRELKAELNRLRERYKAVPESEARRRILMRQLQSVPLQRVVDLPDASAPLPDRVPDPSRKLFAVGARCTPETGDGVVIAQGGGAMGYSLYLRNGRPRFATRSGGQLIEVEGPAALPLHQPTHLVGLLNADGEQVLYVNGQAVARGEGQLIVSTPADGLSVGQDAGSWVGGYDNPLPFRGRLEDIRIYFGALDPDTIKAWRGEP